MLVEDRALTRQVCSYKETGITVMAMEVQNGRNHQKPKNKQTNKQTNSEHARADLVVLILLVECSCFGIFNALNR